MSGIGIQVANNEGLGSDDRPYVTIDGYPFPLVPGSQVEISPLNPFSPSNADGNTTAVLSQRHATQVWDDFTGGVGYLDDDPDAHQYAYGNLDTRVPRAVTVPHKANEVASGGAGALPVSGPPNPYAVEALSIGDNNGWGFLVWQPTNGSPSIRRVTSGGVATVGIADGFQIRGAALWRENYYILAQDLSSNMKLYQSSGASNTMTFTAISTVAGNYEGLVVYDDKLITYDRGNKAFKQWSSGTLTWVAFVGDYSRRWPNNAETVQQLFVWTDKSGSRDALYALTNMRILLYDEEGQQWEDLYIFGDLFVGAAPYAHVSRRDNTLMISMANTLGANLAPETGTILTFTPGTVDNVPINKGYGFPANAAFNTLGNMAPVNHVMNLKSGIHWVYAFCYAPTGLGAAVQGGVYALNELGGWTQVFDPVAVVNATTKSVMGGGYGSGKLLVVMTDGSYYVQQEYDTNLQPPFGTYDDATAGTHDYFLQTGRIWNRQRNVLKMGSHMEFTFQDPIPANNEVYLEYRYYNENGLSAWQSSGVFPTVKKRVSVDLKDGGVAGGIYYYYMEWRLHIKLTTGATAPAVLQFVVLNYTYWQDNHNSYQFAIDLTRETWATYYPDGGMPHPSGGLFQREGLQQYILQTMVSAKKFHTFTYNWTNANFQEVVTRADLLISRRESADDMSGVYLCTVRDLEPDTPAAGVGQHGVA